MPQVYIQQPGQSNGEVVGAAIAGAVATGAEVLVYSRVQTPAIYRTLPQPIYRVAVSGLVTDLGGGFLPPVVAGNVLWLRGDLGITTGAGGVAAQADQSVSVLDFVQAVAGQRPAVAAGIGGQATVDFDRNNSDTLGAAATAAVEPVTGLTVYAVIDVNVVDASAMLVRKGTSAWFLASDVAGVPRFAIRNAGDTTFFNANWTGSIVGAGPVVVRGRFNVATQATGIRVGVAAEALGALATSFNTVVDTINIMGDTGVGANTGGDLAELLVYDSDVSADDATIMAYLNTRYGL